MTVLWQESLKGQSQVFPDATEWVIWPAVCVFETNLLPNKCLVNKLEWQTAVWDLFSLCRVVRLWREKLSHLKLLWLLSSTNTQTKEFCPPSALGAVCRKYAFLEFAVNSVCVLPHPHLDYSVPWGSCLCWQAASDISGWFVLIMFRYFKEIFQTVVSSSQMGASCIDLIFKPVPTYYSIDFSRSPWVHLCLSDCGL